MSALNEVGLQDGKANGEAWPDKIYGEGGQGPCSRSCRKGLSRPILYVFCLVLATVSLWGPAVGLWELPYLKGTDAYYYAVQADSWHETGQVRIPDSSVIHPLIGSFIHAGFGAEDAIRVWTVLSLFLFCAVFYGLCVNRSFNLSATPLFLWPLVSPSLLFCAIEFPKTFSFLLFFSLALAVLKPERRRFVMASALLAVSCAMHKMGFLYVGAFAAAALFLYFPVSEKRLRFFFRVVLPGAAAALFLLALCAFLLPDSVHIADLMRFKGTRLTPGAAALFMEPNLPLAIKVELVLAVLALFWVCFKNRQGARGALMALCLAAPSFIPALGHESFSLGERFGLLLPVMVALACVFLLEKRGESAALRREAEGGRRAALVAQWALWAVVAAVAVGGGSYRLDLSYPPNLGQPYTEYAGLTAVLEKRDIPMLIVHRGMHYYYKFHTRREAFSYEPEKHWPKARIWRLVYGVTPTELYANLPPELGWNSEMVVFLAGTPYTLVREDFYVRIRGAVRKEASPDLYNLLWSSEVNPASPRPAFLYKKHEGDEKGEFSALP